MLSARGLSLARLRALQARAALLRVVQAAPAWPTTSAAGLHPRRAGSTAGAQELNASTASSASTAPEQAAPVPEAQAPPLPLCERPPAHLAPLADLLAWQQRALEHVAAVGDSWQRADEGPSAEDLQVGRQGRLWGRQQRRSLAPALATSRALLPPWPSAASHMHTYPLPSLPDRAGMAAGRRADGAGAAARRRVAAHQLETAGARPAPSWRRWRGRAASLQQPVGGAATRTTRGAR